jgi:hypothetical protein
MCQQGKREREEWCIGVREFTFGRHSGKKPPVQLGMELYVINVFRIVRVENGTGDIKHSKVSAQVRSEYGWPPVGRCKGDGLEYQEGS